MSQRLAVVGVHGAAHLRVAGHVDEHRRLVLQRLDLVIGQHAVIDAQPDA